MGRMWWRCCQTKPLEHQKPDQLEIYEATSEYHSVRGKWRFILTVTSRALRRSNPNPGFQIKIMQPVRSDVKMDALTRPEMFLAFIFPYDLTKPSIAG